MNGSDQLKSEICKIIESEIDLTMYSHLRESRDITYDEAVDLVRNMSSFDKQTLAEEVISKSNRLSQTMSKWVGIKDAVEMTNFESFSSIGQLQKKINSFMMDTAPREQFFLAFKEFLGKES